MSVCSWSDRQTERERERERESEKTDEELEVTMMFLGTR
jgi:hypothetical protein